MYDFDNSAHWYIKEKIAHTHNHSHTTQCVFLVWATKAGRTKTRYLAGMTAYFNSIPLIQLHKHSGVSFIVLRLQSARRGYVKLFSTFLYVYITKGHKKKTHNTYYSAYMHQENTRQKATTTYDTHRHTLKAQLEHQNNRKEHTTKASRVEWTHPTRKQTNQCYFCY